MSLASVSMSTHEHVPIPRAHRRLKLLFPFSGHLLAKLTFYYTVLECRADPPFLHTQCVLPRGGGMKIIREAYIPCVLKKHSSVFLSIENPYSGIDLCLNSPRFLEPSVTIAVEGLYN